MLAIPLKAVPSQALLATLGNQQCQISLKQRSTGLYLDLYIKSALILGGVLCENTTLMVRSPYLGFSGDLMFVDNQGGADPIYTGLGSRFSLLYLAASEVPAGVV